MSKGRDTREGCPGGVIWEVCKFQSYDFRNLYTFTCKFLKPKAWKAFLLIWKVISLLSLIRELKRCKVWHRFAYLNFPYGCNSKLDMRIAIFDTGRDTREEGPGGRDMGHFSLLLQNITVAKCNRMQCGNRQAPLQAHHCDKRVSSCYTVWLLKIAQKRLPIFLNLACLHGIEYKILLLFIYKIYK